MTMPERNSDPAAPPVWVLQALREAGYVEFEVGDGHPPFYRCPGQDPVPWRQAMVQISTRLVRAEEENAKLKAVKPKPGIASTEFWLATIGAAPVVFVVMGDQLTDLAASLPPPWGKVIQAVAGGITALITIHYGVTRKKAKADGQAAADEIQKGPPSA